jgi:transcriptional regulator with XRE-family HTH domain
MTPHDYALALRQYRLSARLRQKTVAEAIGVTQSQVSRWESGRDRPRAENIEAIRRLVMGDRTDPLAGLRHFVTQSEQMLVLFDARHAIIARSKPLRISPNPLERHGWLLDPERNPDFRPAFQRYSEVLARPEAGVVLTISMVVDAEDGRLKLEIRKTIQPTPAGAVCLAEIGIAEAEPLEVAGLSFEELRIDNAGRTHLTRAQWLGRDGEPHRATPRPLKAASTSAASIRCR